MDDLMAGREKYWKELTEEEKIERLRSYAQRVDGLLHRIEALEVKLEEHSHVDGKIVLPLKAGYDRQINPLMPRKGFCYGCEKCREEIYI